MNVKKSSHFCLTTGGCGTTMRMNVNNYSYFETKANMLPKEGSMPIVIAPLNRKLKIVRIAADEKVKKHLENLGILVNGEITLLSASGGSVVCVVKEGRIALDRDISTKIFVAA